MADESYEDYEKKMDAFVNEIPAFKAFRSEFARIGYNLSRSIKARKTNYITEEDLEYFGLLFQRRPQTFPSPQHEVLYEQTVRRLSNEFRKKYGMGCVYKPYVFIKDNESREIMEDVPVGSPQLNRPIDFDASKDEESRKAYELFEKGISAKTDVPGLVDNAINTYFYKGLFPQYKDPEVIERLMNEIDKGARRDKIFALYKASAEQGKLEEVIKALHKQKNNKATPTSPSSSPNTGMIEGECTMEEIDMD